jgi:insecticidal toxin complex protein TccC
MADDTIAKELVTHRLYDPAGRLIASRDPRLAQKPNLITILSLSGQALLTDSVDAGGRLGLLGEAGQALMSWDGRGTHRQFEYDELLRPVAVTEQAKVVERFMYGDASSFEHNQCNQLIRHDDPAGTRLFPDYGLLGSALSETRQFLQSLDPPDWPPSVPERDALLEGNRLTSVFLFNAVGEAIRQTDAQLAHYTQTYNYDAAGNLLEMRHVGAQSFTRTMRVAPDCNRSLPEGDVDVDFAEAFDANGNLQQLIRGIHQKLLDSSDAEDHPALTD